MSTFVSPLMYDPSDLSEVPCPYDISNFVLNTEDMECCMLEDIVSEQPSLGPLQDDTYVTQDKEETEPMISAMSEDNYHEEHEYFYHQFPENQPAIVVPQPFIEEHSDEPDIENDTDICIENVETDIMLQHDCKTLPLNYYSESEDVNTSDLSDQESDSKIFDNNCYETQSLVKEIKKPRKTNKPNITPQLQMRTRRKALIEENARFCIVDRFKSKERISKAQNLQQIPENMAYSCPNKKVSPVKSSTAKLPHKSVADSNQPQLNFKERSRSEQIEVDLYTQMSILKEIDKDILTKSEIASKYNINFTIISNINSNRTQIEETYKNEYVNMLDLAPKSDIKVNQETSVLEEYSTEKLLLSKHKNEMSLKVEVLEQKTVKNYSKKTQEMNKPRKVASSTTLSENIKLRDVRQTPPHPIKNSLDLCTKMKIIKEVEKGILSTEEISKKFKILPFALATIMDTRSKIKQNHRLECVKNCKEKFKEDKTRKTTSTRNSYDLQTKLDVIEEVEDGTIMKSQIAEKYNIPKATLSTILNSKEKVLNGAVNKNITCKRLRYPYDTDDTNQRVIKYNRDGSLKRATIDLGTKVEILKLIDSKKISQKAVAEKFNVATSTICCILKQRKNIEDFSKMNNISKVKFRRSPHMEIEHSLCDYVRNENERSGPMTNTQICLQAVKIAHELGYKNFKCHPSSAWIWRFKKRFDIVSKRTSDEERARVHKALEIKRKVRATGSSYICDLCKLEFFSASAMEKHLMYQHFPTDI